MRKCKPAFIYIDLTSVTNNSLRKINQGTNGSFPYLENQINETMSDSIMYFTDMIKSVQNPGSIQEIGPRTFFSICKYFFHNKNDYDWL